jgi:hypothetical protein
MRTQYEDLIPVETPHLSPDEIREVVDRFVEQYKVLGVTMWFNPPAIVIFNKSLVASNFPETFEDLPVVFNTDEIIAH